ncbi:MAG: beta-lactamase family protein [Halioglobus sp.]|nr:beta-lactamase family protein [Halioglobus sp.]
MNKFQQTFFVSAVLALTVCNANAEGSDVAARVDSIFSDYQGENLPGASVMVIRNGERVLVRSYGMANLEEGTPVRPETNFRLASVTKQFTASSIMLLVERGELSLDDTLTESFAGFPAYGNNISLRHLLQHNSGLIDYEDMIADDYEGQVSDRDALRMMYEVDKTWFRPGTQYRYSNTAYAMLAMLIEDKTGKSYAQFLQDNIFAPLGMDNTVAYQKGVSTVANRAYGYTVENGQVSFSDQSTTSAVLGDGGIYTSVLDYYKWDQALYTDKILSQESLQQMWTGNFGDYGLGWRVDRKNGHRRLHHDGSTSGFRNYVIRYPDDRLTVLVLTNRRGPDAMPLAEAVADLYLSK